MPEVSEDLAGEFVLGTLEADELAAVERRMRAEPDFRRAVDAWSRRLAPLLEQVSPKTPPASAWSAIQRRVGGGPSVARRRSEGVWLDIAPGVQLKMLRVDPPSGERTALLRMEPGASCPAHDHSEVEECFLLEGEVNISARRLCRRASRHPARHNRLCSWGAALAPLERDKFDGRGTACVTADLCR